MRNFLPVFKHFIILLWCLQSSQCQNLSEEKTKKSKDKSLREYLLEGYDKYERPYNSFKNGTRNGEKFSISYTKARVFSNPKIESILRKIAKHHKVYFSIYLMWLAELDCSASNFKGNFYVIFEWDDYRLKFPYEDFGASM